MAESDEDAAVKAMLKEWPQLTGLEDSLLKRMAKIRPALLQINQQTPRAELFSLISEVNDVARHVGDDQPVVLKQCISHFSPTFLFNLSAVHDVKLSCVDSTSSL